MFLLLGPLLLFSMLGHAFINVYSHTFSLDESASFLTFIDEIKVQEKIIENYLSEGDYNKSITHLNRLSNLYTDDIRDEISEKNERVANDIVAKITSINDTLKQKSPKNTISQLFQDLNAILDESITIRLEPDDLRNSTIHALHFAELIISIDKNYKNAFTMEDSTEHGSINNTPSTTGNMSSSHDSSKSQSSSKTLNNLIPYSTARQLIPLVTELYFSQIKINSDDTKTQNITKIGNALLELKNIVDSNLPYVEAAKIIHGIIQPSLQYSYNLEHINLDTTKPVNQSSSARSDVHNN